MKVLKIYSRTCGPCKVLERMMRDLDIKHENVNIDSPVERAYLLSIM